jgi:hypothetical protein
MAGYDVVNTRPRVLFEDHSLVATGTPVVSGFLRMTARTFVVTKKHTTGTYAMTLDWSMDGTNVVFTTTPSLSDNTPLTVNALAPYVRITITATVSNFTVHQTTVMI